MDDLWAEALSEQNQPAAKALPTRCSSNLAVVMQRNVAGYRPDNGYSGQADRRLGRTRMTIKELLRLTQGSVGRWTVWRANHWIF